MNGLFRHALRGWKKPVNLNDSATVPLPFIFEHIDKYIPSAIAYGFSKAMILYHVSDSKTFNIDCLVIADKLFTCLM